MAMKEISPINLSAGTTVELNADGSIKTNVLGGQVVTLKKAVDGSQYLVPAKDTDVIATASPIGFAYTGTVPQPANKMYIPFNQYKGPLNLVSTVLTKGALIQIWNDGSGKVFEDDVFNAAPGTPLFVSANSTLSVTANGTNTNVGAQAVATVVDAPASQDGVLTVRTLL